MFTVILHRAGHASENVHVYSLSEASACVTAFQRKYALGASECGSFHGGVYKDNAMLYWVSYNGRVWRARGSSANDGLVYDPASED